ncbi:MAG: ATP-binding protein [Flavobacteriales bacterium]|nr:ATP-binding protein [Flavobacteriales bacterium]
MARIKITEFGPIKEGFREGDGFIDIRKVTVFIGEQGSGKSSVAKLISTFSWMEKALVRGDLPRWKLVRKGHFKKRLEYHRIDNYARPQTDIVYDGEAYSFHYTKGELQVSEKAASGYHLPQVLYVPAERNFIASVSNPLKLTSQALVEFVQEYRRAMEAMNGGVELPINQTTALYNKARGVVELRGPGFDKLDLTEASSGFQSLVPLYLVSRFLARSIGKKGPEDAPEPMSAEELERFKKGVEALWDDDTLTDVQRRVGLSALSSKFNKSAFINIVEEPEQNLFPTSQWEMLKSLLQFNEGNNKLLITTHSPYLLAYLSLCIQAASLWSKIGERRELQEAVERVVPRHAFLRDDDSLFYQLKSDGTIERIPEYEGIPSDSNSLNRSLREANVEFDKLLEVEQESKG